MKWISLCIYDSVNFKDPKSAIIILHEAFE